MGCGEEAAAAAAAAAAVEKTRANRAAAVEKTAELVAKQNGVGAPAVAAATTGGKTHEASLADEKQEERKAQFKKGADPDGATKRPSECGR